MKQKCLGSMRNHNAGVLKKKKKTAKMNMCLVQGTFKQHLAN